MHPAKIWYINCIFVLHLMAIQCSQDISKVIGLQCSYQREMLQKEEENSYHAMFSLVTIPVSTGVEFPRVSSTNVKFKFGP